MEPLNVQKLEMKNQTNKYVLQTHTIPTKIVKDVPEQTVEIYANPTVIKNSWREAVRFKSHQQSRDANPTGT